MKNLYSNDAFTGLEAAIVLIAFVVVAAVFSYVVLGAGFFTSQTAQATVHTGVQQSSSSMELVGNVYGIGDSNQANLDSVNITIALTAGGTPIDLSSMVVSYNDDQGTHWPNMTYSGIGCTGGVTKEDWCIAQKINNQTTAALLDNNAQMILSIGLPNTTIPNAKFTINLQPAVGAVLPIARTVPGGITPIQPLY